MPAVWDIPSTPSLDCEAVYRAIGRHVTPGAHPDALAAAALSVETGMAEGERRVLSVLVNECTPESRARAAAKIDRLGIFSEPRISEGDGPIPEPDPAEFTELDAEALLLAVARHVLGRTFDPVTAADLAIRTQMTPEERRVIAALYGECTAESRARVEAHLAETRPAVDAHLAYLPTRPPANGLTLGKYDPRAWGGPPPTA
jgi:hypothetical protein